MSWSGPMAAVTGPWCEPPAAAPVFAEVGLTLADLDQAVTDGIVVTPASS